MSRRKRLEALRYVGVAVIAAAITAFFFLHREAGHETPSPVTVSASMPKPMSPQINPVPGAGYKEEDRRKLEQIIHERSKDD